jgi:phosphatidylglycerophosphatase C
VARLALFDLDGTLTRGDTYRWFVARLLLRHPARWPRALLLPAPLCAFLLGRMDRGELKGAILRLLFAGLPRAQVTGFAEQFAAQVTPARMFPAAVDALRGHLDAGDHVVLLSASPDLYVPAIGLALGVHETRCTPIRWAEDLLDGRLAGPNHRGAGKARVLGELRAAHPGLPVIAYGNSTPDLEHMRLCEESVFVNASAAQAGRLAAQFPAMRLVQWS